MADSNFYVFCEKVERATETYKNLKFFRCGKNLKYDSDCIYNFGVKIANPNQGKRMVQNLCYWSPPNIKRYNYAKRMLEEYYEFCEPGNAPNGGQLIDL